MNKFYLIGNLTKDPETKVTQNGDPRTTFTIAVQRPYTGQDGTRSADFILCTAYRKTAELIQKYLAKGRKVALEGHIHSGSYDKDDQKVFTTNFVVETVEFLSSGKNEAKSDEQAADAQDQQQENGGFTPVEEDDDFPF